MATGQEVQDISVNRHLNVGRDARIQGNVNIKHSVKIEGWLDAPNMVGAMKGLFEDITKLNAAYPRPQNGWYALVGSEIPASLYRAWDGKWEDTGNLYGSVELGNSIKDFQAQIDEVRADVDNVEVSADELKAAIDAEAATRKTNDDSLSGRISTLGTTVEGISKNIPTNLEPNLNKLNADLASEVENRTNADTALQAAIDAEVATRIEEDIAIRTAAEEFQSYIEGGLNTEIDNRKKAVDAIPPRIYDYPKIMALTAESTQGTIKAAFTPNGESAIRYPNVGDRLHRGMEQVGTYFLTHDDDIIVEKYISDGSIAINGGINNFGIEFTDFGGVRVTLSVYNNVVTIDKTEYATADALTEEIGNRETADTELKGTLFNSQGKLKGVNAYSEIREAVGNDGIANAVAVMTYVADIDRGLTQSIETEVASRKSADNVLNEQIMTVNDRITNECVLNCELVATNFLAPDGQLGLPQKVEGTGFAEACKQGKRVALVFKTEGGNRYGTLYSMSVHYLSDTYCWAIFQHNFATGQIKDTFEVSWNGSAYSVSSTSEEPILSTSADLKISNNELSLTDMAKKRLFIDQWNTACGKWGTYNEDTGYFELNGLTDITYEEALKIWIRFAYMNYDTLNLEEYTLRTNLPLRKSWNGSGAINCKENTISGLQVVNLSNNTNNINQFGYCDVYTHGFRFPECTKIICDSIVIGRIVLGSQSHMFWLDKCVSANFKFNRSDFTVIPFGRVAKLNYESYKYLATEMATQTNYAQMIISAWHYSIFDGTATDLTEDEILLWEDNVWVVLMDKGINLVKAE